MSGKTIIVIPSQGKDTNSFEDVAKKLKREVYKDAVLVKTKVTDSGGTLSVTFITLDGKPFDWATTHDVGRVLTISHAYSGDGPNLAYHAGGYQPWGQSNGKLSDPAKAFWQGVGKTMRSDGKILLLGCFMGQGSYAGNVASVTGKQVFAATDLFGAGDSRVAVKTVKAIEKGGKSALKEFTP